MADQFIQFPQPSTEKLTLFTGRNFVVQIKPGRIALRAEMEDLLFNFNSAVMLPEGPREEATDPDKRVLTGLEAIAATLSHAALNPDRKILVTGHADTVGGDADNLVLSDLRSKSVLAVLTGDRQAWVDTVDKRHKVEDYQAILKWVAKRRGWPTDPGEVDGQNGPKTQEALLQMQKGYNSEFGKAIAEDGKIGKETWGAIFDLYQDDLAFLMQADAERLKSIRAGLAFVDGGKKQVGCGEHFPVEQKDRDNFKSRANRRVEILFFEPGQEPKLPCHASAGSCDPEQCEVYGKGLYTFGPIPEAVANGPVKLALQYEDGSPMALAEFEAHFGEDVVEGITDGEGKAVIDPPPGAGGTFLLKLIDFPEAFA